MLSKPLSLAQRVALWDGALSVIRAYLREEGLLEVSTRTRVEAPAIEPHIEPLTAAGHYLATSPEIEMKQLLAAGSGSIFQIAHVFRGGEVGPRHREEFHLVEWYRVGKGAFAAIEGDVEVIVERVRESVARIGGEGTGTPRAGESTGTPRAGEWARRDFADLWSETVGRELPTGIEAIERELVAVSGGEGHPLSWPDEGVDPALRELDAWTSLFSWWSDRHLDPWLAANPGGLHLHRFPAALAALAQVDGPHAHRFESYAGGVELANGYLELRDGAQQRARFERVNAQRARHGLGALPVSQPFCDAVDRLPPCAGVAMGLERLLCLASGASELSEVLVSDALPGATAP